MLSSSTPLRLTAKKVFLVSLLSLQNQYYVSTFNHGYKIQQQKNTNLRKLRYHMCETNKLYY